MSVLSIEGGRPLSGHIVAPPDKSISHRAPILAALGEGASTISPLSDGADNRSTLSALSALGAEVTIDDAAGAARVVGVGGVENLRAPQGPIDCGNSGTTMRLLAGVLAGAPGRFTLTGDDSLCGRPMSRLRPLEAMGAALSGVERGGKIYPPLTIDGGTLSGMRHELPIASAQVKSAILLAGLFATGPTRVVEPSRSRDHTERMLRKLGVDLTNDGDELVLEPLTVPWSNIDWTVAPDLSSAAFLLAAGALTEGEVSVRAMSNPTRSGFLDALRGFGVEIEAADAEDYGTEPVQTFTIRGASELRGTEIAGALTLRAIDEIPLLAGLAAFAEGRTVIRDAAELRVKESDRLSTTSALIRAFGGEVEERPDGLVIEGKRDRLHAAEVDGSGDHRIALTAAVMGLGLRGCTRVRGAEIIDVSYPDFQAHLLEVGAEVST